MLFSKSIYARAGIILATLTILVAACGSPATEPQAEVVTLRMAVLPILDNLPMYVAEEQGYYAEQGVLVEFVPVFSAAERDQIIQAGQAEGMINELVSTLFYNQDTVNIQVVRFARTASREFPQFRILASADSGISSVEQLKGVEIGISEGTVIEYLTDRLLVSAGFNAEEIMTISVPGIPDRLALLNSGELSAAMLPDPLSSLAIQSGATVVIDDTSYPEFGYSVISFRKPVIDDHPEAIRGFLAAVEQAVEDINADPSKWDNLLAERGLVPEVLLESYEVPQFPLKSVPTEAQFADVVDWMKDEGLISRDYTYAESVTNVYLP